MTQEDQVFVVDVVVIDMTWEMVASSVISWLVGVAVELSAIVKIHKYRRLYEGHHFISMAMEVHDNRVQYGSFY
jgi:presenilin-like A22 family membrane protease